MHVVFSQPGRFDGNLPMQPMQSGAQRGLKQVIQKALKRAMMLALPLSVLMLAACSTRQTVPVVDRSPAPAAPAVKPTTTTAPAAKPAAPSSADFYTVKRGDTLFGIALDHGHDYREMAAWNNIVNPSVIQVGQVLRMTPPPGTPGTAGAGDSGVVVRPITPPGGTASGAASPPAGTITEPRGDKRPYSDEALAQAQGQGQGQVAAKPAAASPAPKPADKPGEIKPATESDDVAWGWPAGGRVIGTFSDGGANKGLDIAAKVGDPVLAAGPGKVVYSGQGLRGYGRLVIIKHNNTYLSAYAHNSNLLVKEGQLVTKGQKIAEAGNSDSDVPKLHFEIRRQGKPVDPVKFLPER